MVPPTVSGPRPPRRKAARGLTPVEKLVWMTIGAAAMVVFARRDYVTLWAAFAHVLRVLGITP